MLPSPPIPLTYHMWNPHPISHLALTVSFGKKRHRRNRGWGVNVYAKCDQNWSLKGPWTIFVAKFWPDIVHGFSRRSILFTFSINIHHSQFLKWIFLQTLTACWVRCAQTMKKNVIRNSGVWDKKREKRCDFFVRNESVFSDVELKTNFIDAAD